MGAPVGLYGAVTLPACAALIAEEVPWATGKAAYPDKIAAMEAVKKAAHTSDETVEISGEMSETLMSSLGLKWAQERGGKVL
jgi:hypothetical protein